jgi:cell division protein FtsB
MVLFDANSWLIHSDLNDDIETLNSKIEFYKDEIDKDKKEIKTLNSTDGIEKYAREHYKMKKENEVVYIIEDVDSLKTKKNE